MIEKNEKRPGMDIFVEGAKSRLIIDDGVLIIKSVRPAPNWWHRLWYKILLGWKWERIND